MREGTFGESIHLCVLFGLLCVVAGKGAFFSIWQRVSVLLLSFSLFVTCRPANVGFCCREVGSPPIRGSLAVGSCVYPRKGSRFCWWRCGRRVRATRGGCVAMTCGLCAARSNGESLMRRATTRRPFRFVSNLNAALRTFRSRVMGLRGKSGFRFAVPFTRTCNRCSRRRMVSLPGGVFRVSKGFSGRRVCPKGVVPLVGSRNRHLGNDMIRMGTSAMIVSVGRPLTNRSLAFINRIARDHPTAGRRVRRVVGVVANRNKYDYKDYNSNYNSSYKSDYKSDYNYKRYRWSQTMVCGAGGNRRATATSCIRYFVVPGSERSVSQSLSKGGPCYVLYRSDGTFCML